MVRKSNKLAQLLSRFPKKQLEKAFGVTSVDKAVAYFHKRLNEIRASERRKDKNRLGKC